MTGSLRPSISFSNRCLISCAAAFVNVITRILPGSTPHCSTRYFTLWVIKMCIRDRMQSGRDQQTLQESVNKCAKCSRRCKKMTETIDDYVKYRPYKEHKQA